jgi:hypothetical protein
MTYSELSFYCALLLQEKNVDGQKNYLQKINLETQVTVVPS